MSYGEELFGDQAASLENSTTLMKDSEQIFNYSTPFMKESLAPK
ncbi:hypothetical protein [Halobacillus salinus]|nr:hypothetical protein [Halobacillus salinus]